MLYPDQWHGHDEQLCLFFLWCVTAFHNARCKIHRLLFLPRGLCLQAWIFWWQDIAIVFCCGLVPIEEALCQLSSLVLAGFTAKACAHWKHWVNDINSVALAFCSCSCTLRNLFSFNTSWFLTSNAPYWALNSHFWTFINWFHDRLKNFGNCRFQTLCHCGLNTLQN